MLFSFIPDASDLLTGIQEVESEKSDLELLNEILDSSTDFSLSSQWPDVSQSSSSDLQSEESILASLRGGSEASCFLPSQLLDMNSTCSSSQSLIKGKAIYICFIERM